MHATHHMGQKLLGALQSSGRSADPGATSSLKSSDTYKHADTGLAGR
jgi:hypothetical protein